MSPPRTRHIYLARVNLVHEDTGRRERAREGQGKGKGKGKEIEDTLLRSKSVNHSDLARLSSEVGGEVLGISPPRVTERAVEVSTGPWRRHV